MALVLFESMMKEMEMINPTSDIRHRTSDISLLTSSVNPIRLKNNPVELDAETIHELYKAIVN